MTARYSPGPTVRPVRGAVLSSAVPSVRSTGPRSRCVEAEVDLGDEDAVGQRGARIAHAACDNRPPSMTSSRTSVGSIANAFRASASTAVGEPRPSGRVRLSHVSYSVRETWG